MWLSCEIVKCTNLLPLATKQPAAFQNTTLRLTRGSLHGNQKVLESTLRINIILTKPDHLGVDENLVGIANLTAAPHLM